MIKEPVQRFRALLDSTQYFSPPKSLFYFYVIALSFAYIVVVVHTPLTLYPSAPHDDGLFMSLGRSLAEGHWLGLYTQFTLMKGPGYPAFLAVANWLGISASLAHALFYCAAVTFFIAIVHRFIKSYLISGLLLFLLLWQLLPTTVYMDRILREQIGGSQLLFLFAAAVGALFHSSETKRRLLLAALTGFFLGWFWLTREEAIWVIPGAIILVAAAALPEFRIRRWRKLAGTLVMVISVFASIQVGFRAINWAVYGKFIGVDFKEANFQRALRAIDSVRSGGIKPFVAVTQEARKRIYAVSPSFASLARYFDVPSNTGWGNLSCNAIPISCGEIASGYFMWALRGAVAAAGHYSSPAEASAFYGRLADEISAACALGALICEPQLIGEMPPMNWGAAIGRIPSLYARAFEHLIFIHPPLQFNPSSGSETQLDTALQFLNYPRYTSASNIASAARYSLSGWYLKSGHKWLWATVKAPDGSPVEVRVDRNASPDLQAGFKNPEASHQRFIITTRCNDECTLELESQDGEIVQKKLSELRRGSIGFALGTGNVHVDSAIVAASASKTRLIDVVAGHVRQVVLKNYVYVLMPTLILGATLFVITSFLYRRRVVGNVSYIIALCSWVLIIVRVSLIVLVAATSFPALRPALFMASSTAARDRAVVFASRVAST